jgi:hypothetical protein
MVASDLVLQQAGKSFIVPEPPRTAAQASSIIKNEACQRRSVSKHRYDGAHEQDLHEDKSQRDAHGGWPATASTTPDL